MCPPWYRERMKGAGSAGIAPASSVSCSARSGLRQAMGARAATPRSALRVELRIPVARGKGPYAPVLQTRSSSLPVLWSRGRPEDRNLPWSDVSAHRGRSRGRASVDVLFVCGPPPERRRQWMRTVKGSRVSLSTSIMSRRPTTDRRVVGTALIQIITCQSAVSARELRCYDRVEHETPHLALGAGGACDSSHSEGGRRTLGSTPSTHGACATAPSVLQPRIRFRGHGHPRFEPTNRRARGRGGLAEASASVGVELMRR
jgi:hypothetical protein